MGFLVDPRPKKKVKRPTQARLFDPERLFIRFDSGEGVTFEDARHHTLILGTTGSGKTESVILPAIYRIIRAGFPMIICDIKGNLSAVRKFAALCGRDGDVVEYGCGSMAERVNILAGLDADNIRKFFETMVRNNGFEEYNRSWDQKGALIAADCAILLRFLAREMPELDPTLAMVNDMINDHTLACQLYTQFLDGIYDKDDPEQRKFVTSIGNNHFHLLRRIEKDKDGKLQSSASDGAKETYAEQMAWNLQAIRNALRGFLEAPGVALHFAAQGQPCFDICTDILARKIILVRFDSQTGKAGAFLTRTLLNEAYRIILDAEVAKIRQKSPFFVVLDEFQELADFSDGAGSDKNFVALAREFGGCFLAGTQSMAALTCKVGNTMPVESFVGNINNIISFYGHDAATQGLMARYDGKVNLNRLKPGQVFAVTYNGETRQHRHGRQTVNKIYRETAELLSNAPEIVENSADSMPSVLLSELAQGLDAYIADKKERLEVEKREKEREAEAARKEEKPIMEAVFEEVEDYNEPDPFSSLFPKKSAPAQEKQVSNFAQELKDRFGDMFTDDFCKVECPVGWKEFLVRTLSLFEATGMEVKIYKILVSDGCLSAIPTERASGSNVLNKLLSRSSELCIICGKPVRQTKVPCHVIDVCDGCRKRVEVREMGKQACV